MTTLADVEARARELGLGDLEEASMRSLVRFYRPELELVRQGEACGLRPGTIKMLRARGILTSAKPLGEHGHPRRITPEALRILEEERSR